LRLPISSTDFIALMETEARVAGVEIVEYRMDQALAFDDVRALTRRLLTSMLNALQRAAKHSAIRVNTIAAAGHATIGISGTGVAQPPVRTLGLRATVGLT
jgi:hypothetical protein